MGEFSYYQDLFAALRTRNVASIACVAHSILGMPVVACDASLTVVAKYPDALQGDEQWDADVVGLQTRPEFVQRFASESFFTAHEAKAGAILVNQDHYEHAPRLSALIRAEETVIGYFVAYVGERVIQDWHYEAVGAIADAFSIVMSAEASTHFGKVNPAAVMLRGLLRDDPFTSSDIKHASELFRQRVRPPMALVAARMRKPMKKAMESYVSKAISTLFETTIETTVDGVAYLISSALDEVEISNGWLGAADRELRKLGVVCGISRSFNELGPMQALKWQADHALGHGLSCGPGAAIYRYDDHLIEIAMSQLVESVPRGALEHPLLGEIKRYDELHGTDYLETLEAYVATRLDKKAAAERLHLHRNTLLYRLEKMESLFDLSLSYADLVLLFAFEAYASKGVRRVGK